MALFIFAVFFLLMAIGTPIGFVMGLTALFGFYKLNNPAVLTMLPQIFFSAMDNFALLALPFFILSGDIMNRVGLTEKLIDFSNVLFGRLRGGLAQVNIVTSVIFGGISGSAVADMAALGNIFIPSMTKEGYGKDFSTALSVASSIIAPIIPPSIIMVIYGAIMGVSIAGLFAAGIVPGFMICAGLMILTRIISGKRNYPKHTEKVTLHKLFSSTRRAIWALIMPVIILGGILGGIVTPTEAAAIAVGYALLLGLLIYRNLSLKDLFQLFYRGTVMMGIAALLMSSAAVLAWLLANEQIPTIVAKFFLSITHNKYVILLLINLFLILVGMLMDIVAALVILAPILAPLATNLGVHPLHFGIIMCVNLNIGLMTPPVGGSLFFGMIISRLSMGQILRQMWPFCLVEVFVLFLIVYIPDLTMFIPKLLGFYY
ncbi:MAG: TRAP transporter large permease [Deltaproteobacteria bacterium]|nr:TRAP transporter large permease [Deltaproteobacteria bacterium]